MLKSAPQNVRIGFTEIVTFSPSNIQILNSSGNQVPAKVTSSDSSRTVVIATPEKALPAGRYAVRWSVTSGDGHVVSGAVAFTVNKANKSGNKQTVTLSNGTKATLSADKPGQRSISLATSAKSGTIELTHPSLGAPLRWKVSGSGSSAKATGVLPFAGTWTVKATLRVGSADSVGTGSFTLQSD